MDGIDYKIFIFSKRAEVIKHEHSCKMLYLICIEFTVKSKIN